VYWARVYAKSWKQFCTDLSNAMSLKIYYSGNAQLHAAKYGDYLKNVVVE
jgi:hypothetical protein